MALLPLSPAGLAVIAALPRTSRPAVAAPTKRPTGGRPNPCAVVSRPCPTERLPSPSSSPRLPRRSGGRSGDQAPPSAEPESIPCTLLAEAVARGTLPVGQPITGAQLGRVIGKRFGGGWDTIALRLTLIRSPIRLREIGNRRWIIALV